MTSVASKIKEICSNMIMAVKSCFWKRDPSVVLFGAWFGEKFADNSRFLFQYLHENKSKLGLTHIVWVTSNASVCNELRRMGYEAYVFGSEESITYHKIAKYHIICNAGESQIIADSNGNEKKLLADIETKYSWRAKRVNLWHGAGFKSVGEASNSKLLGQESIVETIYHKTGLNKLANQGGWDKAYYLCTSQYNLSVNKRIMACDESRLFISCYPRNCPCIKYFGREIEVIETIKKYRGCVLYLPTFRSDVSSFVHPLMNSQLNEYLQQENLLWIEKPHSVSNYIFDEHTNNSNVLILEKEFDVNVLYSHISLLLSDYSSAISDTINQNVPTIIYAPDIINFKNGDVGFLIDMESYFDCIFVDDMKELAPMIRQVINGTYFTAERVALFAKVKNDYFDNIVPDYERVWNDISNLN